MALVITGLTVTVFFQLLSSGLRLEYNADQTVARVVDLGQTYNHVLNQDVRESDFPWQEDLESFSWTLKIERVETMETIAESDNPINLTSELYRYVFDFKSKDHREWKIIRYVQHDPGYFSQDFRNTRLE